MAINRFDPNLAVKSDESRITMWRYLFVGLFILGTLAVAGAIYLMAIGKESAPAWVLATAVVSGTIGLFAESPTTSASSGQPKPDEPADPNAAN